MICLKLKSKRLSQKRYFSRRFWYIPSLCWISNVTLLFNDLLSTFFDGHYWKLKKVDTIEKFTQTSLAYLDDYGIPWKNFIDIFLHDFNYDVTKSTTELPEIYLRSVEQPKLGYLKLPNGGCSGAKYVALIKTSYTEYSRRSMIRKMFKSQLKDENYDLFFLVGFKRNQFLHDSTSDQLVNKDKVLMKEFQKFNDLGKISYKG